MRVKVTYVDFHFGDGLTSITYDAPDVDTGKRTWFDVHRNCECQFVNAHLT